MFGFRRLSDPTKSSSASDTQRVIVKDDSSDSVVSDGRSIQGRGEPQSLRERLHDIMTTQAFHIAILVLVILDCVLVVTELVLDFQLLESESNCEVNGTAKPPENEVSAVHILHYFSLTILSIFMLELIVKILVFQMEFFRSKLEVFDGLVIIVSFVLDILSLIYEEEFAAAQLIVLLRLWRIVRVVNGVILSVETQAEKKIEQQKHLCEEVEHELEKFRQYCTAQEKEIEILRNTLNQHGIKIEDDYVAEKPKISLNQVNVVVEVNASEKLQLGVEADEEKSPGESDGVGERKGETDQGKQPREGVQLEPAPQESVTLGDETMQGGTVQAEFHSNASSVA
ncbi:voltage-gated hydrogen channel 1-like [Diadema antillarum]|uniref:voltage-gated hydrogen channel 1-like n=1 Tax=Diadema antillarum TaxID=105358 RepID=UPI003A854A14